jgi:hypothetical protein
MTVVVLVRINLYVFQGAADGGLFLIRLRTVFQNAVDRAKR